MSEQHDEIMRMLAEIRDELRMMNKDPRRDANVRKRSKNPASVLANFSGSPLAVGRLCDELPR